MPKALSQTDRYKFNYVRKFVFIVFIDTFYCWTVCFTSNNMFRGQRVPTLSTAIKWIVKYSGPFYIFYKLSVDCNIFMSFLVLQLAKQITTNTPGIFTIKETYMTFCIQPYCNSSIWNIRKCKYNLPVSKYKNKIPLLPISSDWVKE